MQLSFEHLSIPRDGERENGDAVFIRPDAEGAIVAVIDALGHGALAALAARAALEHLAAAAAADGPRRILEGMHRRLRGTRGAAGMVCVFTGARVEGCGVGNVDLRALRGRVPVVLSPGVLGGSLTRLRVFEAELSPGDRLVFFTDGLTSRFEAEPLRALPAAELCRRMMERYRRSHDDATVLVADLGA